MKKLLLLSAFIFFFAAGFAPPGFHCPVTGLKKDATLPAASEVALNKFKNRSTVPNSVNQSITLEKILAPGDDKTRFHNSDGAAITGYISDVKSGGAETCNCYYAKEPYIDTHIEIALTPCETDKRKVMAVEITPRFKATHAGWTTKEIKKLIGKKVTITGWMMFDQKHWHNSVNTNPQGTNLYRATAWEIHPITAFKIEN